MTAVGGLWCVCGSALPFLLLLLLWLATRKTPRPYPVCGGCGYAVQGAVTFICPECGYDLRGVGIERYQFGNKHAYKALSLLIALLILLSLLFFVFVTITGISAAAQPFPNY